MSARNKPTGNKSREVTPDGSTRANERKGPISTVTNVLGKINKVVYAAAGTVVVVAAAVAILLPSHPGPSVVEATFDEAKVEPDVLLEQYESDSQTTASTDDVSQGLPGGYWLAADTAPASARPTIGVLAIVSESATATSASSSTAASISRSDGEETGSKEEEKTKKELQIQEAAELKEEARQKEQAHLDEEKVRREEARQREEAERGQATQLKGREQAQAEEARAQAKAREEATVRAKEAATVEKEAEHPASTEPSASSTPLHREGHAKVLIGTGVPAGEVKAVLSKAGVNVSSNCGASCGLTPAVDKAIADDPSNLDEAAREVAAIFNGSRVGVYDHKSQPVGATVDYAIDFVGYARKRMILEWTLRSKQTERPLLREWWRNVIVKQIEPTSNSTKIFGNFWAPIPPQRGDYYFRLKVFYDESEAAHGETDLFH
jgi:flagellar biosynthesis GTPase FlhF